MREYTCLTCLKKFERKYDKSTNPRYCSRQCYQIREKSPETIKKMSEAKIGRTAWNKGVHMWEGGYLNADHILPFSTHPDLRLEISNGRTVCVPCHKKTDTYGVKIKKPPDFIPTAKQKN